MFGDHGFCSAAFAAISSAPVYVNPATEHERHYFTTNIQQQVSHTLAIKTKLSNDLSIQQEQVSTMALSNG